MKIIINFIRSFLEGARGRPVRELLAARQIVISDLFFTFFFALLLIRQVARLSMGLAFNWNLNRLIVESEEGVKAQERSIVRQFRRVQVQIHKLFFKHHTVLHHHGLVVVGTSWPIPIAVHDTRRIVGFADVKVDFGPLHAALHFARELLIQGRQIRLQVIGRLERSLVLLLHRNIIALLFFLTCDLFPIRDKFLFLVLERPN